MAYQQTETAYWMSALGHWRTFAVQYVMSALHPKADICSAMAHVRQVPIISKCGDEMMRVMLYEAAQIMLVRSAKWSWLKAWAIQIARRRGMKKAIVALARRLAVIMHRIWVDGTEFRWSKNAVAA